MQVRFSSGRHIFESASSQDALQSQIQSVLVAVFLILAGVLEDGNQMGSSSSIITPPKAHLGAKSFFPGKGRSSKPFFGSMLTLGVCWDLISSSPG